MCNVPSGAEAYGALYASKSSDGVSFKCFALKIERLAGVWCLGVAFDHLIVVSWSQDACLLGWRKPFGMRIAD